MTDRVRYATGSHRLSRSRPPGRFGGMSGQVMINIVAAVFGLLMLTYLATGHWWLLVILVLWAGAGVDQALRSHPVARFVGPAGTAMYLFVPVLLALGEALFFHDVSSGLWNVPAAAFAALCFSLAANAEYLTIDISPATYPNARFVLSLTGYITGFAFFTVVSTSGLNLPAATLVVAAVALLLSVDVLRELEVQSGVLFAYAGAIAVLLAEVRWALYFLALPDLLAGGLLLITFYEATGIVQSYLSGHLDRATIREFSIVGVLGLGVTAVFTVWSRNA